MEKVISISDSNEIYLKHRDFNKPPDNLRMISLKEFAKSDFFSYPIKYIDFRQLHPIIEFNGIIICELHLFYIHSESEGIAISADRESGNVYYFKFGCDHKDNELSPEEAKKIGINHYGMFCHVYKCIKCIRVYSTDSSG